MRTVPEKGVGKCEQRHHCVPMPEMATGPTAANRDSLVNCSACCTSQIWTQEGRQADHRDSLSHHKMIWTLRRGSVIRLQQSLRARGVSLSKENNQRWELSLSGTSSTCPACDCPQYNQTPMTVSMILSTSIGMVNTQWFSKVH